VVVKGASDATCQSFADFAVTTGVAVRRALVAAYGVEIGTEAAADALSVVWERWDEVRTMENPGGFVFRVGQSRARPHLRWARRGGSFPVADQSVLPHDEAMLDVLDALRALRTEQRIAVLMVKSYGFSYRDVGDLLGVTEAAVTNHVHRGLARLRSILEVE
jgi:RNA polymerase sigma-70 factor (ECF subfamily)